MAVKLGDVFLFLSIILVISFFAPDRSRHRDADREARIVHEEETPESNSPNATERPCSPGSGWPLPAPKSEADEAPSPQVEVLATVNVIEGSSIRLLPERLYRCESVLVNGQVMTRFTRINLSGKVIGKSMLRSEPLERVVGSMLNIVD